MLDKVLKAWECCDPFNRRCFECPYEDDCFHDNFDRVAIADMVKLLKEQQERIKVLEDEETAKNKPMKVIYDMNPMTRLPVSFCPICGYAVDRYAYGRSDLPQVFCPYCGQALDWKDGDGE